jgi:hypothetical protein
VGYLLRLATLNRYDTLSWILQLAQIKRYVQSKLSFAFDISLNLTPLLKLTGVDKEKLAALLYSSADNLRNTVGDYLVFGSPVPQYMIRLSYPKICPECLRETGYIRKLWELSPITTCPLHRCLLLDECPNCRKRLTWSRPEIGRCRCRFSWHEYKSPLVTDCELQVTRQIYLLCDQTVPLDVDGASQTANPLRHLELKHLLSALFFIASQFKGIVDTKGKHLAPSARNAETHMLLCKAWTVFEYWPNNFFNFLNWRRAQVAKSRSASGLLRDFSEYKSALYQQLISNQLDFIRVAFEEYLANHWAGGYTSQLKRIDKNSRQDCKYASRREAKQLLKVGVQSIDQLIAVGKLKAIVRKQGKAKLILIERASLLEFKGDLDQSLYLKQVQGLLGLSHRRLLELVACGLLNPLRGPTVDGCSDWRFREKEVEDLLDKIKKTIRSSAPIEAEDTVSFLMAFRKLNRAHIAMGQFIKDIFTGEVYPCEVSSKTGLDAFQFSKRLIAEYVCRLTWNSKDREKFCFPVKESLNGQTRNLHAN